MPHLVFTMGEIAGALLDQMEQASAELLALSDLKQKPLDPGESVASRHHKIAKLGKKLAELFQTMHELMQRVAGEPPKPEPGKEPVPEQAN